MLKKICANCGWSVYRGGAVDDEMIDDKGISKKYICRKLNLQVYGIDRACPLFVLADEYFEQT